MNGYNTSLANEDSKNKGRFWIKLLDEYLIWILILLTILITTILLRQFLTMQNMLNILSNSAILGIMVIAESLCLLVGKFDLSIESTLGLSVVLAAILTVDFHVNAAIVWIIVLACGSLIGLINGILIEKLKINAFIQTLAMLLIIRGLVIYLIGGRYIINIPYPVRILGAPIIGIIPISIIIMIVLYIFFIFLTENTRWGRYIYATGSNPQAAFSSGIKISRINIMVFVLAGLISAFAGLVFVGRQNAATWLMGQGMIFEILAAAVIGGISLSGGKGRLISAIGGVIFLGLIRSVLTWLNLSVYIIDASRGFFILFAITLDALKTKIISIRGFNG